MKLLSLGCLLGLVIAATGAQDSLTLPNGRSDGVVYAVTIKVDGKSVTYNRGQFTNVTLGENGADSVTFTDGTAANGTLENIRMKTLGGILTYKRTEFSAIKLNPSAVDAVHKEYITRRYSVDQASPEDLFKLAQWCMDKKLRLEAYELARMSLAVDQNSSVADAAHDMLGEVWSGDKWVPKSQARGTDETKPTDSTGGDTDSTQPASNSQPGTASPEAIREASALFRKLSDEYKGKLKDINDREFKAFTDKYKPMVDAAKVQVDSLKKKLDDLTGAIRGKRDEISKEKDGNKLPGLRDQLNALISDLNNRGPEYQKAQIDQTRVNNQAKSARDAVVGRARDRSSRVEAVRMRIPRLLGEGKLLTETDMRTMFESAMQ